MFTIAQSYNQTTGPTMRKWSTTTRLLLISQKHNEESVHLRTRCTRLGRTSQIIALSSANGSTLRVLQNP